MADLLRRLERRYPWQRLVMVEEIADFQSRVLCEHVTAKSRELASDNPAEAVEWGRAGAPHGRAQPEPGRKGTASEEPSRATS